MSWNDNDFSSVGNEQWVAVSSVTGWPPTVVREASSEWLAHESRSCCHWWWADSWVGSIRSTYSLLSLCSIMNSDRGWHRHVTLCHRWQRPSGQNVLYSTFNPVCPQQSPPSWIITQLQASTESRVTLSMCTAVVDCKGCKVFDRPLYLVQLVFVHLWVCMQDVRTYVFSCVPTLCWIFMTRTFVNCCQIAKEALSHWNHRSSAKARASEME